MAVLGLIPSQNPLGRAPPVFAGSGRRSRFWLTLLCPLLLLLTHGAARAQLTGEAEYKIKAVFLYHFVQFVDWPPDAFANPEAPYVIGVLGRDPFGPVLEETVAAETIKNRGLRIRRYQNVSEVKDCHVLFICDSEEKNFEAIITALKDQPILIVGEGERFARQGGSIRLFKEGNKIRLRIDPAAAARARLELSSKLLRLADLADSRKAR